MIQLTDPWTDLPLTFRFDAGPSVHSFPPLRAAPVLGGHLRRIIKVVYTPPKATTVVLIELTLTMTSENLPCDDDTIQVPQIDKILLPQNGIETDGSQRALYILQGLICMSV